MKAILFGIAFIIVYGLRISTGYAQMLEVRTIQFHGLKYVATHEIASNAVFIKDGKMFVNTNALHANLRANNIIKEYSISVKDNICSVQVNEKEIIAILMVAKGEVLIPLEIDVDYTIISTYRVHAYDRPIIKVSQADIVDNRLSPRILNILMILKKSLDMKHAVASRISNINCTYPNTAIVQFHGLQSKYIWDETYNGLELLASVLGLYDKKNAYPNNAVVTQKRMVVW